jgi:hypothetical protein
MKRSERRLKIARKLLDLPDDADVMACVNRLPPKNQRHLREQTDWVEQYELHEEEFPMERIQ